MESETQEIKKVKLKVLAIRTSRNRVKKALEIQENISKKAGDWKGSEFIIKSRQRRAI